MTTKNVRSIRIQNYKSIVDVEITLGSCATILFGENGTGKTNVLEGISLIGAALNQKLSSEFLFRRGIRVVDPNQMRSLCRPQCKEITFSVTTNNRNQVDIELTNDGTPYTEWKPTFSYGNTTSNQIKSIVGSLPVYCPRYDVLRRMDGDQSLQPLGVDGQGLLKLLAILVTYDQHEQLEQLEQLEDIKSTLSTLGWDGDIDPISEYQQDRLLISDSRFPDSQPMTQKHMNEAYLIVLFYATMIVSEHTSSLLVIDNFGKSLSHNVCIDVTKKLIGLAEKYNKQVVFSTRNPAVLDGINLLDETQKLHVVSRHKAGYTDVRSIAPNNSDDRGSVYHQFIDGKL